MALKEARRHKAEERVRDRLGERGHALVDRLALLRLRQGLVEDRVEGRERVLVHVIHNVQEVHQEVDERAAVGVRPVRLEGLADLDLLRGGDLPAWR